MFFDEVQKFSFKIVMICQNNLNSIIIIRLRVPEFTLFSLGKYGPRK